MKYVITDSTDKQFLGREIEYDGELFEGISEFIPDGAAMRISEGFLRLHNSNYSIDIKEVG